jgi:predicted ArsR family transcriptional regulator
MGFQQIPEEVELSHDTLRLHLARLERQGTQESQKQIRTSKLPPNPKTRIKTI